MRPALAWAVYAIAVLYAARTIVGRRERSLHERVAAVGIVAITVIGLLVLTSGPVLIDFDKAYLFAGRSVLADPSRMYACDRAQCFVNIPIVSLLFVPFAWPNAIAAGIVFSAVGIALFAAALRRLAAYAPLRLVVWLALICGPLYYSVRIGNTTHMLLLPLLLAFEWIACEREIRAAVMLAALALIKPPLALFLPYFIVRGRMRAAAAMAAFAAATVVASVSLFGLGLHVYWFREFVVRQGSAPIGAYNVQSVNGALARLVTRENLTIWQPIAVGPLYTIVSGGVSAVLLLGAATACWRAGRPRTAAARATELWIVLCLCLIVAPISWTHYYVLLLVPLSALLGRWSGLDRDLRVALCAAVLLLTPPVVVLELSNVRYIGGLYDRVLLSHYFFGGLVLLGVLIRIRLTEVS